MRVGALYVSLWMGVAAAIGQGAPPAFGPATGGIFRELVKPSATNPSIQQFDENNVILLPGGGQHFPLVVFFLPEPEASRRMLGCCSKQWRNWDIESLA